MTLVERAAGDADASRLAEAYFAELRQRLGEFEPSPIDERAVVVAYDDGLPVACGSLRLLEAGTAEVKRMYVSPEARGAGVGRALLRALEDKARAFGCTRVVLDTAAPLEEAARMYLREGYAEVARFNDNPYAARWFEKVLTAEWRR